MLSAIAPRRHARPLRSLPLAALPPLCLLVALLPVVAWHARSAAPEITTLSLPGRTSGRAPLSPDQLPAGLYPALLATLNRTAAPAYRLAPLPVPAGHGTATVGGTRAYAGANPAATLRLRLDTAGLTIHQQGRPGALHLALAGLGRGDRLTPFRSARPSGSGGEVRYDRGTLVEWYRNGPLGLEQGFSLAASPPGSGPLTVRLRLSGGLVPRLSGGALLLGAQGLRYAGLYAQDAIGRRLPAHLTLRAASGGWSLGLVVDDRRARYPLAIDPTFTLQTTFTDPGTGADEFGYSVALSGDGLTALIGGSVAAYVYRRAGTGVAFPPSPSDTLVDPGPGRDSFGISVALSRDGLTALIGAPTTGGANTFSGAAYVYRRASTAAAFPASPSDSLADPGPGVDLFGSSVALSSDGLMALVGAPGTTKDGTANAGAAYAYRRAAGAAFPTAPTDTLGDPGGGPDRFGFSVALADDGLAALVGAPGTKKSGIANAGAAYAYRHTAGTAFSASPSDTLPDPGPGSDRFGNGVALSGDGLAALVGASGAASSAGAAYGYRRSGSGVAFSAPPSDTFSYPGSGIAEFGHGAALSTDGLTALIGAPFASATFAGAAYAFGAGGASPTTTPNAAPTAICTATPTATATATATGTSTATASVTSTATATATSTRAATPTPTSTGVPSGTGTGITPGTATPELGSGGLLATGLLPIGALLLALRRRARQSAARS